MNLRQTSLTLGAARVGVAFAALLLTTGSHAAWADKAQASTASVGEATTTPDESGPPRLRYRIAVDQGKWEEVRSEYWTLPPDVREGIQSQLVDKLQKSGYFIVMEREATAQQQMGQEDQIAAIKANSLPAGATPPPTRQQRTPANFIITPSVIGYTVTAGKKSGFNFGGFASGDSKTVATVTLNVRISDAQTSTMLDSQTSIGTCEAKSNGVNYGGIYTSDQFQASPSGQAVDRALDDAVAKIVARLSQEPWTALVAAQDKVTRRVIINAGTLAGVQVGQTFDVFHAGQPITDPDTGDIISQGDQVKVGRIKIVRLARDAAYADVVEGRVFLPRDIVQQIK